MDWIWNEQSILIAILIGVVFVIGIHFDLHLRHIAKILAETNDTIKSVEGLLDSIDGRLISPEASKNHFD